MSVEHTRTSLGARLRRLARLTPTDPGLSVLVRRGMQTTYRDMIALGAGAEAHAIVRGAQLERMREAARR